jgi:hypothetical protein
LILQTQPKNSSLTGGMDRVTRSTQNDYLTTLPQTNDMIALQSCQNSGCLTMLRIVVA